mgnify:CR=1 FL=1
MTSLAMQPLTALPEQAARAVSAGLISAASAALAAVWRTIFGYVSWRRRALQSGRQAGPQRGSDLRFDMEITFEEAAFGVEREINLTRDEQCQM